MARLDETANVAVLPRVERRGPSPVARLLDLLARFGSVFAFLLAWEILASSGLFTPFLLPKFSVVVARIAVDMWDGIWFFNIGETLYRAVTGFACAAFVGVTIGILMGRMRFFRWFFDPVVSVGFPSPKIAFLPIFILWFDLFDTAKIVMIAFSSVFTIIAASWAGTFTVDKHYIWSARSLGASGRQILTEIVLPAALPQILTGLQIALPIAMIVALVTEFLMGGTGLGGAMIEAQRFGDSPGVFAGIVSIALAGITLIKTLEFIRKRLLSWHSETAATTA